MPNWKKLITSGSDASLSTLTINNSGSTDASLLITATEDSSNAAPVVTFKRNSNSPADADYLGQLKFKGENDADQEVVYAKITAKINDASDGSEDGLIEFANRRGGLNVITARFNSEKLQLLNGTDLDVDGQVSASSFIGDGSNLTGINASIISSSTVSDTFTNATAYTASHTFGTKDVIVNVYDDNDRMVIPQEITTLSTTRVGIDFGTPVTGRVVIGKAGHIVSGSSDTVNLSNVDQHIIPATDNTYDLGSPTNQWRDLYLSSASLYIDGQQVISSTSDTLTFTTDVGQSIKLLETGADDIILQTDTGNIELKGTVEILSGKKITDSAGTLIQFGDTIGVTGSIETTGTVDGIDLQAFSSSVATSLGGNSLDMSAVSQSILPHTHEAFDLGSPTKRWKDLYLSGSTIDLGGTKISTDSGTGDLVIKDSGDNLKSIQAKEVTIGTGASKRKIKVGTTGKIEFRNSSNVKEEVDLPAGVVSSSAQITTLTSYTETFTSQTAVTASHSLGTKNISVSVYGSDDFMIFPTSIKTHDVDNVYVQFNSSRSGRIVITK